MPVDMIAELVRVEPASVRVMTQPHTCGCLDEGCFLDPFESACDPLGDFVMVAEDEVVLPVKPVKNLIC